MFEAARVTDPIEHTSALTGFLIGAVLGVALIAAVAFATFTCGFGVALLAGLAAGVGASAILGLGEAIGKSRWFTSTTGTILTGSTNVFVNGKLAAFATASTVACSKHSPVPLIAQGSGGVFINSKPAARKGDKITCGAAVADGSSNVFMGGGTQTYLPYDDEVPPWLRTTVDWAFALAGLVGGLAGLVKAAGGQVHRRLRHWRGGRPLRGCARGQPRDGRPVRPPRRRDDRPQSLAGRRRNRRDRAKPDAARLPPLLREQS